MKERKAFGRLDEFQALQFRLADMATGLEASRTLLWRAAAASIANAADATQLAPWPSASSPTPASISPIKRCNCTAATVICRNTASRNRARSARVHQILEGTNEIMRVIVARNVVGLIA